MLEYDAPLTRYWPEYGAEGKGGTTVAHVLTHSAGVPQLPGDLSPEAFADVPGMAAWVARQAPLWEPGTRTGYHAATFGYLVDELVRRAAGKTLDEATRELVTGPLGVADSLAFSVPERLRPRLATVVDEPGAEEALQAIPTDAPFLIAGPKHLLPGAAIGNRPDFQAASHAAGVKTSARALARVYAALAGGGELDGVRILKAETVARATALQTAETDEIVGMPIPRSLGYNLGSEGPSLLGGADRLRLPGSGRQPGLRRAGAGVRHRRDQESHDPGLAGGGGGGGAGGSGPAPDAPVHVRRPLNWGGGAGRGRRRGRSPESLRKVVRLLYS